MSQIIMGLDWGTFLCCAQAVLADKEYKSFDRNIITNLIFASVLLYPVCSGIFVKLWLWSTRERYTGVNFVDNGDTLPASFNFSRRDFVEGEVIYSGSGRCVLRAQWNGDNVAVKKFTAKSTSLSVLLMEREATRLLRLRHPNVLHLLGYYFEARRDVIQSSSMVMELMDCDLKTYIKTYIDNRGDANQGLPFGLYVIQQIARGMRHVHGMGYCHRDLKPQNVLVRENDQDPSRPEIKIADFGSAEIMREMHSDPNAGSPLYRAPEQLTTSSSSTFDHMRQWVSHLLPTSPRLTLIPAKADVFSFGVLCTEILTGREPYSDQRIETSLTQHIRSGNTPTIPDGPDVPEEIKVLIMNCFARNPESRPEFWEICRTLDLIMLRPEYQHPALDIAPVAEADGARERIEIESRELERGVNQILDSVPEEHIIRDERMIRMLGKIGQGTDATVYKVEWNDRRYAGRVPLRVPGNENLNEQRRARLNRAEGFQTDQVAMLPTLTHENIVRFFAFSTRKRRRYLMCIMELMKMDLGQLTLMRSRGGYWKGKRFTRPYDNKRSRKIMIKIAAAMEYLHSQGIWHGDLHCSNILVSHKPGQSQRCLQGCSRVTCFPPFRGHSGCLKGMIVKLCDFGSDPLRCAYDYAAPEVVELQQDPVSMVTRRMSVDESQKCDVYSFAVVCYQILSGDFPLDTEVRMTCRDRRTTICNGVRPRLPAATDDDVKKLIHRCWHDNPERRPTFSEIHRILSSPTRCQKSKRLMIWRPLACGLEAFPTLVVFGVLCALAIQYIIMYDKLQCPASCKSSASTARTGR